MVRILRSQPQAGTVVQPQSASVGLFPGHFQPFLTPGPLYTLVVDLPAFQLQQGRNTPKAIASILAGQYNDPFGELLFIISSLPMVALGGARLFQCPADTTLRYLKHFLGMLHCSPASGRASQFPRTVSRKIELSSERSATSFFSRAFFFSRSFNRRA